MRRDRLVSDQDLPIRVRCIPGPLRIWSILSGSALTTRNRNNTKSVSAKTNLPCLGHRTTASKSPPCVRRAPTPFTTEFSLPRMGKDIVCYVVGDALLVGRETEGVTYGLIEALDILVRQPRQADLNQHGPAEALRARRYPDATYTEVAGAFGCLENLAWIWVLEKNIRGKAGAALGRYDIGLGKQYVRASFSPEFQTFLD